MQLPCGTLNASYAQDMAVVRTRLQWIILILSLALLLALPTLLSSRFIHLVNNMAITLVAVLGLQLLFGYGGQISLGQSAFMAVGAYTSAALTFKLGVPFFLALPASGLSAALVGLVFGIPSVRIKGFYLAMATIAAQFIIMWVIMHWRAVTGGLFGLQATVVRVGGLALDSDKSYFYVVIPVTLLLLFLAKNLARTKMGRALVAIRDNDLAAQVLGVNLFRYKLLAFFLASFYAGVAGSLMAHSITLVHPDQFSLMDSIWYLAMIIIGGLGSITGAVFGVAFFTILRELVDSLSPMAAGLFPVAGAQISAAMALFVFGLVIVLFLIFEPRGIYHRWTLFKAYYRLFPFPY